LILSQRVDALNLVASARRAAAFEPGAVAQALGRTAAGARKPLAPSDLDDLGDVA